MDLTAILAADPARAEILRQIEAALLRRAPDPGQALAFLHHWAGGVPTDELAAWGAEDAAAAALALFAFAALRPPGQALVRVRPAAGSGIAVAEIITDDMPFLVDSALAVFQGHDLPIHSVVHPILRVRRDGAGALVALGGDGAAESMIQIAFAPQALAESLAALEAALAASMVDVRVAVADFQPLRARLAALAERLPEGAERAFLGWLGEDNFVFLGARSITPDAPGRMPAQPDLGLLRDPARTAFDAMSDPAEAPALAAAARAMAGHVAVAKADMRSTVHRPQLCDVIVVREDAGEMPVLHLFVGLFAADAYTRNPRAIPWLGDKVKRILAGAGLDPLSHDGRALRRIVDTWPRDDLFQGLETDILAAARRTLSLQIRPDVALFVRRDLFGRHLSAIVLVPRDRFDTRLRLELSAMLARAYGGTVVGQDSAVGDGPLARLQCILATDLVRARAVDVPILAAAVAEAARGFGDRLAAALGAAHGLAAATRILGRWGEAFPTAYTERHAAADAVADIARAETALADGRLGISLDRPPGMAPARAVLRLVHPGEAVALSAIVPLIETLGLSVIEEIPYRLAPRSGEPVALQALTLQSADGAALDLAACGAPLAEALGAIWDRHAEADGFNCLVLLAGLAWREAWLLRALFKWCRQIGFPFSQAAVEETLGVHPRAARLLIDLFHARFDPARLRDPAAEAALEDEWANLVEGITSSDEDRILRRLRTVLDAVLRTNYYFESDVIALKIDSAAAGEMPAPRPLVEIWVHGARMEGCHLRGGRVARGGIRWSDRREDFRTEILGLMKAQMVKNVVIVPVGSKGGFVLKRPPAPTGNATADREAFQAEGIACYRLLIGGMLDVTDTLREGAVVPPARVVRRDGDDPYLVVAADKGTATFSDIANGIAVERGFWLGDAFASGGSVGYDHKGMGITAKGAWVNIARHFREMERDIFAAPFTCVGVGDMSGDVFGNGLLISRQTRLLAAFDHRHIFLDPDPDPEASFAERARLFALPRSAWADYDHARISAGGGVFPRSAKGIVLAAPAAAMLGLPREGAHEPAEIIRAILRMAVDLLYFGGIGTYVKATTETQADAGDRASDAVRVDARELRAKVVGEGANLAVTMAGRIEAARHGVRLNTDALDNSAGVSTSDHEVNIKILLADGRESGRLTERQRVETLAALTDEVAELVLRDNHQQSLAISLDLATASADLPAHAALMGVLEGDGILDRAVAGLPEAAALAGGGMAPGLTRPELCSLMAHAKLWLSARIDASDLPDDPALLPMLVAYFPAKLHARFTTEIARHRLRRELIATAVTNELLNRLGSAAFGRLVAEAGHDPIVVARAALVAKEALGLAPCWAAVDAADGVVPAAEQIALSVRLRQMQEATTRHLAMPPPGPITAAVAALADGVAALKPQLPADPYAAAATLAAAGAALAPAAAIVRLAGECAVPAATAAAAWRKMGEAFGLDALGVALGAIPPLGAWTARAAAALADDLGAIQGGLAGRLLQGGAAGAEEALPRGLAGQRAVRLAREAAAMPDLASATVALRALRMV